jgi:hypothetical protein
MVLIAASLLTFLGGESKGKSRGGITATTLIVMTIVVVLILGGLTLYYLTTTSGLSTSTFYP